MWISRTCEIAIHLHIHMVTVANRQPYLLRSVPNVGRVGSYVQCGLTQNKARGVCLS